MSDRTQEAREYLKRIPELRFYEKYIDRTETGLAGDFAYDLVEYLMKLKANNEALKQELIEAFANCESTSMKVLNSGVESRMIKTEIFEVLNKVMG